MAKGVLFIGWGLPVRGREQKALQVFGEAMEYYARLQQQGEIESFEPVQLEPHGGDLSGFALLRGDAEKLAHLKRSEEFLRLMNRTTLVVDNFGIVSGFTGEEQNRLYADFLAQASQLA